MVRPLGAVAGPISGALTDIGNSIGDSFFIDYVNPVVQQWNFNIQQQLGADFMVEAAYVGTHGTHLMMKRDINQAAPVIGVVTSVVGAYYYLYIVKLMYFDEPVGKFEQMPYELRVVLAICVVLVLAAAVGVVGVPVSAGEARGAREVSEGCT